MITICIMFAAKGSVKEKAGMLISSILVDSIYIIPLFF